MTPESAIKQEIIAYLKSVGAWTDMPVRTGYGPRGKPDILACFRGRFIGLEVKARQGVATPWQRHELATVIAAGGIAQVVWSVAQVKEIIDDIEDAFQCSRYPLLQQ